MNFQWGFTREKIKFTSLFFLWDFAQRLKGQFSLWVGAKGVLNSGREKIIHLFYFLFEGQKNQDKMNWGKLCVK